jgi:hypothetical protein
MYEFALDRENKRKTDSGERRRERDYRGKGR